MVGFSHTMACDHLWPLSHRKLMTYLRPKQPLCNWSAIGHRSFGNRSSIAQWPFWSQRCCRFCTHTKTKSLRPKWLKGGRQLLSALMTDCQPMISKQLQAIVRLLFYCACCGVYCGACNSCKYYCTHYECNRLVDWIVSSRMHSRSSIKFVKLHRSDQISILWCAIKLTFICYFFSISSIKPNCSCLIKVAHSDGFKFLSFIRKQTIRLIIMIYLRLAWSDFDLRCLTLEIFEV